MAPTYSNGGASTTHTIFRIAQILTLIPAWAILAAVIDHYNRNNVKTPSAILFLFVVALLASVWSFCALATFLRARNTALWMTFLDVVAMVLLIAAVVMLMSNFANVGCIAWRVEVIPSQSAPDEKWWPWDTQRLLTYRKYCGEIKAAWGLAIANIIFFFITAFLTAVIYRQNQLPPVVREEIVVEHSPRLGYSHSPVAPPPPVFHEPYYGPPRRHSRGHRSHRSQSHRSHSHRSRNGGSYHEGSRRGSHGPDYYV